MTNFRNINFPSTYKYSSDSEHIPLEFYEEIFPISESIDLLLGYFSTNAIKVLSRSLAEFIYSGGVMRVVTNHVYGLQDYKNLIENTYLSDDDKIIEVFSDLEKLENSLSSEGQHFFDCLKYLLAIDRLQIVPVKFNGFDLAHCKKMILFDGKDYISTDGSINFTLPALLRNSESLQVNAPWVSDVSRAIIEEDKIQFESIITKKNSSYNYIDKEQIEVVINSIGRNKDIQDLLEDSLSLTSDKYRLKVKSIIDRKRKRFEDKIQELSISPRFPFSRGPREYQIDAYEAWKNNAFTGVFAMATGTGKTITSLNCLLNLYRDENYYRTIILVPSIALLNQWEDEVKSFNFSNILKVGGGNNWEKDFANYCSNFSWGLKEDLVIISTYGSFTLDKFQRLYRNIQSEFLLIADEAHNMGANNIKNVLKNLDIKRKIGLSATFKRIYDPEGTEAINTFFNDETPYTYNFSMEKALEFDFLTGYKYYPIIVELTEQEFEEYTIISKQLLKYFDFKNEKFRDDPMVEILLLKRKNIIHKANNKIDLFSTIVEELKRTNKDKYVFAYIPEGYISSENGESIKILDEYLKRVNSDFPDIKMNSYTSEDQDLEDILKGFEEGKIEILFAMKMLDEGVDIPRAEVGIFASSTGNPRQFIQRRGRLLRKHKDKIYSTIYDMVVIPQLESNTDEFYSIEKNLVRNELNRVAYFSSLSMNFYDSKEILLNVCRKYDLDLDTIINDL